MIIANRSDIGKVRSVNEDSSWAERLNDDLALAIVADGMGGHQAGDVASQMAVDAFRELFQQDVIKHNLSLEECRMLLRQSITRANEAIFEMASRNEQYYNMGTTIVAALLSPGNAIIGHVGDSRAYRIASGRLEQLTEDHTLVNELVKSGQLNAEEAASHPRRNVLTRAVGTDAATDIDIQSVQWSDSDILLLCSDGLTNMVSEELLLETASDEMLALDERAGKLVELALQAGGDDNITVILLQTAGGG